MTGFVVWYANFFSILVVAGLAMHALWPMVSLSLGWSIPSFYYIKVGLAFGLCARVSVVFSHHSESLFLTLAVGTVQYSTDKPWAQTV